MRWRKKCVEDSSNIVHERIEVVFDENQKECKIKTDSTKNVWLLLQILWKK